MRALLFSISLLAVIAVGCNEPAVSVDGKGAATETAAEGIPLDKVDATGLEAAIASHKVTLVDFTAVW